MYNREYVPHYSASNYNPFQNSIPRAAYLETSKRVMVDKRWYLDSRATNSLQDLNLGRDYSNNQLLLVGSGQELHISPIGYACFNISCDPILHK